MKLSGNEGLENTRIKTAHSHAFETLEGGPWWTKSENTSGGGREDSSDFHPTSSHGCSSSNQQLGTAVVMQEDRSPRISFIPLFEYVFLRNLCVIIRFSLQVIHGDQSFAPQLLGTRQEILCIIEGSSQNRVIIFRGYGIRVSFLQ